MDHPRPGRVACVGCRSAGFRRAANIGQFAADQPEISRILELRFGRERQLCCGLGKRPESRFPSARPMRDRSTCDLDLVGGNARLLSRRRDEHRARCGASLAHLVIAVEHRRRPGSALHTHVEIGVARDICGRGFHAHLLPVGVQFFGGEGCQSGKRTLSEFDVLGDHGHGIVRGDPQECVRSGGHCAHRGSIHSPHCLPARRRGQKHADNEATSGQSKEIATRCLADHVRQPFRRPDGSPCGF